VFCAIAHDDLGSAIAEVVVGSQFFSDRLAQLRDASAGVYFVKPASNASIAAFFICSGVSKSRFASAEAANIHALGFHGFGLAVDREGERRAELSGAFGNFPWQLG